MSDFAAVVAESGLFFNFLFRILFPRLFTAISLKLS